MASCRTGRLCHGTHEIAARLDSVASSAMGVRSHSARWKQPAGFQYSRKFLDAAEDKIPRELLAGEIISFNQHFPRAKTVHACGGRISYYIDATFASLSSGRGLDLNLPSDVVDEACELERENYELADRVVAMARWTAKSVVNDCRIAEQKVFTVLPGANLELPDDWLKRSAQTDWSPRQRPPICFRIRGSRMAPEGVGVGVRCA